METEVHEAAAALVSAFGEGRLDDYFACFAPDATFVFYTTPQRLMSVEEYRTLWDRWVAEDGFRVLSCRTSNTHIQPFGELAVLTHSVETRIATNAGEDTVHERETIVMARQADGRWLGVHEHLSPRPEAG
ncbi:MAG: nuclear transport factor 2 family protein [Actinomycetota bacterium]